MDIKAITAKKLADEKAMRAIDIKIGVEENKFGQRERQLEMLAGKQERIIDSSRSTEAQWRKAEKETARIEGLINKNMRDYERVERALDAEYCKLERQVEAAEKKLRAAAFAIQRVALVKAQKLLLSHGDGDKASAKIVEGVIKQLSRAV